MAGSTARPPVGPLVVETTRVDAAPAGPGVAESRPNATRAARPAPRETAAIVTVNEKGRLARNEHGLTLNDYEVMLLIDRAEHGVMRRVDLAESVLLTASGITDSSGDTLAGNATFTILPKAKGISG